MEKLIFLAAIVLHYPSGIILCWFGAQKHFLLFSMFFISI